MCTTIVPHCATGNHQMNHFECHRFKFQQPINQNDQSSLFRNTSESIGVNASSSILASNCFTSNRIGLLNLPIYLSTYLLNSSTYQNPIYSSNYLPILRLPSNLFLWKWQFSRTKPKTDSCSFNPIGHKSLFSQDTIPGGLWVKPMKGHNGAQTAPNPHRDRLRRRLPRGSGGRSVRGWVRRGRGGGGTSGTCGTCRWSRYLEDWRYAEEKQSPKSRKM